MHCEHSIFMNKSHPLWMAQYKLKFKNPSYPST